MRVALRSLAPLAVAVATAGGVQCGTTGATTNAGDTGTPTEHRSEATVCAPMPCASGDGGDGGGGACTTSADCLSCGAAPSCRQGSCFWDQCLSDSECADGGVCSCGYGTSYPQGVCAPANCRTDSDCGPRGFCSPSRAIPFGYYCHTAQDSCENDADCNAGGRCVYQRPVGHWGCAYNLGAG
jgi:Dickkopf N-terminal cysteine-rich region